MIKLSDVKENKVLSAIIDTFNFEYDESLPYVVMVFHNTEESKDFVESIDLDYEPSLQGLKEIVFDWYRKKITRVGEFIISR